MPESTRECSTETSFNSMPSIQSQVLQDSLDQSLHSLEMLDLVRVRSLQPDLEYIFKHALTQDVAYSTLLQERKKMLHGIIGKAIETLYAGRLPENYEVLAYHYQEGEVWDKALGYVLKSATKSVAAFSNHDALIFFDRALEVHKNLPSASSDVLIEIYWGKSEVYFTMFEWTKTIENYNLLLELARYTGDRVLE